MALSCSQPWGPRSRREPSSTAVGRVPRASDPNAQTGRPFSAHTGPLSAETHVQLTACWDATVGLLRGLESDWWVQMPFPWFSRIKGTPGKSPVPQG